MGRGPKIRTADNTGGEGLFELGEDLIGHQLDPKRPVLTNNTQIGEGEDEAIAVLRTDGKISGREEAGV